MADKKTIRPASKSSRSATAEKEVKVQTDNGGEGSSKTAPKASETRILPAAKGMKRKKAPAEGDPGPSSKKGRGRPRKEASQSPEKKLDKGKGPTKVVDKGKGREEAPEGGNDDRPKTGIERQPGIPADETPLFIIRRLIRATDKVGKEVDPALIDMEAKYFKAQYGDFLLECTKTGRDDNILRMRNYEGQERYIPKSMLQYIELPWGFDAATTEFTTKKRGFGLPLRFFNLDIIGTNGTQYVTDEVVMLTAEREVAKDKNSPTFVLDHEITKDSVPLVSKRAPRSRTKQGEVLRAPYEIPWQFPITKDSLELWQEYADTLFSNQGDESDSDNDVPDPASDSGSGAGSVTDSDSGSDSDDEVQIGEDGKPLRIRCGRPTTGPRPCQGKDKLDANGACHFHPNDDRVPGYDIYGRKL